MNTTYGCKKTEIYCAIINSGTLILSLLPSDKTSTPHFHQFGELTAERRFLFAFGSIFRTNSTIDDYKIELIYSIKVRRYAESCN